MKLFSILFADNGTCTRYAEDKYALVAELAEEFPGRQIISIDELELAED